MAVSPGSKRRASSAAKPAVKRLKVSENGKGVARPAVTGGKAGKGKSAGKPSKIGSKKPFEKDSDSQKPGNGLPAKPNWKNKGSTGKTPGTADSKTSAETKPLDRKARKELREARKKKRRTHYDLEKDVVALWEKMRIRNASKEERSRLASEALKKMKGKLMEMSVGHITSRVLQACVKHCHAEERTAVYEELRPQCLTLARNVYAYHIVTKMFDHANKEQTKQMIAQLHGHVVALLRHPSGSAVVEHAFNMASKAEQQELVSEFYSPEFRLFKGIQTAGTGRIDDVLKAEPSKRNTVLQHMTLSLQPILEKGIVDHSIVHRVIAEYLSVCSQSLAEDVVKHLAGPLLLRMVHTKDGAKVGVACVTRGGTKERKKIVKALKGHVGKVARDEYGHMVLLSILNVVDDTTLVSKFIIKEMMSELKDLALDKYGRRLLLHLLAPGVPRYFPAPVLTALRPQQLSGGDEEMRDTDIPVQEAGQPKPSEGGEEAAEKCLQAISKKDPDTRRRELLVDSGLAKSLLNTCVADAGVLLTSICGTDLVYEGAMGGFEGMLWASCGHQILSLHKAIADLAASPMPKSDGSSASEEHVLVQYHASRTIRRLVLNSLPPPEALESPSFSTTLWECALQGRSKMWAQGFGSKVLSAFRECLDRSAKHNAHRELQELTELGLLESVKQCKTKVAINKKPSK